VIHGVPDAIHTAELVNHGVSDAIPTAELAIHGVSDASHTAELVIHGAADAIYTAELVIHSAADAIHTAELAIPTVSDAIFAGRQSTASAGIGGFCWGISSLPASPTASRVENSVNPGNPAVYCLLIAVCSSERANARNQLRRAAALVVPAAPAPAHQHLNH
jgi:hypothetical protein